MSGLVSIDRLAMMAPPPVGEGALPIPEEPSMALKIAKSVGGLLLVGGITWAGAQIAEHGFGGIFGAGTTKRRRSRSANSEPDEEEEEDEDEPDDDPDDEPEEEVPDEEEEGEVDPEDDDVEDDPDDEEPNDDDLEDDA